jgi:Flp pilus assembly protein TadG
MRHAQRGSSMIEFSLVALVLIMLVLGTVDFGRALYTDHAVANLARVGSRWAAVHGSTSTTPAASSDVQTYVQGRNSPLLTTGSITVTTTWPGKTFSTISPSSPTCPASATGSPNSPGNIACVQVQYTYNYMVMPFASKTFTKTSEMVISN